MGALTIKNYTFETRIWELKSIVFPNLVTSFPSFLTLYFKNTKLVRILPQDRNDFISNQTRFAYSFFKKLILKPLISHTFFPFFNQLISYSFYPINFVYNIKFNGLLKTDNSLLSVPFVISSNKLSCILPTLYIVECLGDDCSFVLCKFDIKTNYPDFFHLMIKDQFSFTEEENYDDEAIVEKGDRYNLYFRMSNSLFVWFFYQASIDLLIYLLDDMVKTYPYDLYSYKSYKLCTLSQKDIQTEFYYLNSFGLPINEIK